MIEHAYMLFHLVIIKSSKS